MSHKIIGRYIKNINFAIPDPQTFFEMTDNIKNYKINIDIKSNQFKNNLIEIELSLSLVPTQSNFKKINTKITYASIVELSGDFSDKKKLERVILIDVPSEVYPDLRKIFISIFESSGFKDINIEKNIDFKKLHSLKRN